ncbi:MAG: class I SAM-dependent methyltransferase [Solirubrobacterales bacterium]|nr:class I SAM-dependent methyltransferase [Solirubrobacterales bacterium]
MVSPADVKALQRATWAAGHWDAVAELVLEVGAVIVERTGVGSGMDVLDVGTGSGNAAIPAARAGARVTGSDLTPELFGDARARAATAGVEVEWVEADAEDLPFADGSFDRVLSTFGHMFAPRHAVAGAEMVRVCRPGGAIGTCTWTPEGFVGGMFKIMGSFLPPPPDFAQPPILWGTEDHVRECFAGLDCEFERRTVRWTFASPEEMADFYEANFGPTVMAKALLEPQGRWGELRERFLEHVREASAEQGRAVIDGEYLVTVARKPG